MGVLHRIWRYFRTPTVRVCLDVHTRTIVVLTGGKLLGIYFLQFIETWECLVATSARREYALVTYAALSTQ
jgi:hypothetical protein